MMFLDISLIPMHPEKNPKYFPDLFVNHCYSVSFRRVTGLVKTEIYIRIIYCFKDI